MIKPSLNIKPKGTGSSRPERYIYGGYGGGVPFLYDSHVSYDDPLVLYGGTFEEVDRIAYGDHVLYGGTGQTFAQVETKPQVEVLIQRTQYKPTINNIPSISIL